MSQSAVPQVGGEEVFVRRASGLTRQVSAWDALVYCSMGPGITNNYTFVMWTAYLYPGIHYPLATLVIFLFYPISALYWLFAVAMPRSGGEYVYITRTLHPALGMMASFIVTILPATSIAIDFDWATTYGIGNAFHAVALANPGSAWGFDWGNFFWQPWTRTALTVLWMAIMVLFWVKGTRWVMNLSWAVIGLAVIMLGAAAFVIVSSGGTEHFVAQWNAWSDVKYQDVLAFAADHKFEMGVLFGPTLMGGLAYVGLSALGWTFSANIAGEVRGVQRTQMIALFGALIVQMIMGAAGAQLSYWAAGFEFHSAMAQIWYAAPDAYPAVMHGREPFITLILSFFTNNPAFLILFGFSYAVTVWAIPVALGFGALRNIFAWSFDRVIPAKYAELDRKYKSPWLAILTYAIVGEILSLVYIWAPQYMSFIGYYVLSWFIAWIVVGIAGVIFPWRRKDIFQTTPPLVQGKWFGIYALAILGALTVLISMGSEYFQLVPFIEGRADWRGVTPLVSFVVIPFIIYFVSKWVRSKGAVPLEMQFTEIPPE
jgi:amino acid transporter